MSDSDLSSEFRADVSGDPNETPDPSNDSPSTSDSSSTGSPAYDPDEPIRVFVRGHAESYDQSFVVALDVRQERSAPAVEELYALSTREREDLATVDLNPRSHEFPEEFSERLKELEETDTKDSANLRNKLERILRQSGELESLTKPLFEGQHEDFESVLREFLLDEIYPGSQLELTVEVTSVPEDPEENRETTETYSSGEEYDEQEETEDEDEQSEKLLQVSPEVDPIDGVRLRDLRLGNRFDVRVVGHSVMNLRPAFVEGDEPGEAKKSKLFNAKLVGTEDVAAENARKYIVRLTEDIYGRFTLDTSTKVKIRNVEDLSFLVRLRRRFFYVLAMILIFLFSASLVFFLFPDPVLNALRALGTAP